MPEAPRKRASRRRREMDTVTVTGKAGSSPAHPVLQPVGAAVQWCQAMPRRRGAAETRAYPVPSIPCKAEEYRRGRLLGNDCLCMVNGLAPGLPLTGGAEAAAAGSTRSEAEPRGPGGGRAPLFRAPPPRAGERWDAGGPRTSATESRRRAAEGGTCTGRQPPAGRRDGSCPPETGQPRVPGEPGWSAALRGRSRPAAGLPSAPTRWPSRGQGPQKWTRGQGAS